MKSVPIVILLVLFQTVLVKAAEKETTVKVLKEQCLKFTKIPTFEQARRPVDYNYIKKEQSWGLCQNDSEYDSQPCSKYLEMTNSVRYSEIKKFEIFNSSGQLITTVNEVQKIKIEVNSFSHEYNEPEWRYNFDKDWIEPNSAEAEQLIKDLYQESVHKLEAQIMITLADYSGEACKDSEY